MHLRISLWMTKSDIIKIYIHIYLKRYAEKSELICTAVYQQENMTADFLRVKN